MVMVEAIPAIFNCLFQTSAEMIEFMVRHMPITDQSETDTKAGLPLNELAVKLRMDRAFPKSFYCRQTEMPGAGFEIHSFCGPSPGS